MWCQQLDIEPVGEARREARGRRQRLVRLAQGQQGLDDGKARTGILGLNRVGALEVLQGVDGLSFNFFESKDVVRHPVVARIVQAYEAFDAKQAAEKTAANTNKENTSKESEQ